jgi:hypothetical protein
LQRIIFRKINDLFKIPERQAYYAVGRGDIIPSDNGIPGISPHYVMQALGTVFPWHWIIFIIRAKFIFSRS